MPQLGKFGAEFRKFRLTVRNQTVGKAPSRKKWNCQVHSFPLWGLVADPEAGRTWGTKGEFILRAAKTQEKGSVSETLQ